MRGIQENVMTLDAKVKKFVLVSNIKSEKEKVQKQLKDDKKVVRR